MSTYGTRPQWDQGWSVGYAEGRERGRQDGPSRYVYVIHGYGNGVEVFDTRKAAKAFRDTYATSFEITRQAIRSDRWAARQIASKGARNV